MIGSLRGSLLRGVAFALLGGIALSGLSGGNAFAEGPATHKVRDRVVAPDAMVIEGPFGRAINGLAFQQEAVWSFNGYQYVGYYGGDPGRVRLARRKLPDGEFESITFPDYDFSTRDAHDTISIGICPNDGTIHLSWDHHNEKLKYRRSKPGVATNPGEHEWDASLFGPIRHELISGKRLKRLTYPRFLATPEGDLHFMFRLGGSGNGDRYMVDYDGNAHRWRRMRQVDSRRGRYEDSRGESDSRCSYPNRYWYGPDGRLHRTWTWREDAHGANHDICYAWSDDGGLTWRNNGGEVVGRSNPETGESRPMRVDSPGLVVVPLDRKLGLMNTQAQGVDSEGRVHTVMWHCTEKTLKATNSLGERWGAPEARRYHHYWRNREGEWQHRVLPGLAGDRPQMYFDEADNAYLIFGDEAGVHSAGETGEGYGVDLVIMAASADSKWTDWKRIHTEPGPFLNDMLADPYRVEKDGVMAVMVQEAATEAEAKAAPLRIVEFKLDD